MRMQRHASGWGSGCNCTLVALLWLMAVVLMPNHSRADEVVVQNDSVVVNSSTIAYIGDFFPGDEAGARLTIPCDGRIVGVQIGWFATFPANISSIEAAIHIYEDGTFPIPGAELAMIDSPELLSFQSPLTVPTIAENEFRWLDVDETVPLDVPVLQGEVVIVTLEFANLTNIAVGGPNIVTDFDGCAADTNVLYSSATQTWFDSCTFRPEGDIVVRLIVDCSEEGACCFDDGTCAQLLVNDCEAQGGTFAGEGVDCITADCPQPFGACCIPSTGECVDLLESQCTAVAGVWVGLDTSCATTVCFLPGACCMPDGSCTDTGNQGQCNTAGGSFQGDGTNCGAANCPQPCPSDIDESGEVEVLDLISMLAKWGPCPAPCPEDIDGSTEVDVLDLIKLLADWGPCS